MQHMHKLLASFSSRDDDPGRGARFPLSTCPAMKSTAFARAPPMQKDHGCVSWTSLSTLANFRIPLSTIAITCGSFPLAALLHPLLSSATLRPGRPPHLRTPGFPSTAPPEREERCPRARSPPS